jgi:predicted CXXCH cytochrome family protein
MRLLPVIFLFIFVFISSSNAGVMTKHPPFADGDCMMCHVPGKDGKTPDPAKFTMAQPDMCYQCHEQKDSKKYVHAALGMGDCTMCHSPHQAEVRPLLKDTIPNTCSMCHDAPGQDKAVKHSALIMTRSCVRCHSPHSSDKPKLLKDSTVKLCTYCHTAIDKGLKDPTNTIHPAIQMGCQSCHDPHGSNNAKLIKQNPNELCFTCHDKGHFADGHPRPGHPISGKKDPIYPDRDLTCISCHKPHFSPNKRMLRYNFNQPPYAGNICSVCHWQQILPPPGPPTPDWD